MYAAVAILALLSQQLGSPEAFRLGGPGPGGPGSRDPALKCEDTHKYLPAPGKECKSFAGLYLVTPHQRHPREPLQYPVPFMIEQSGCNANLIPSASFGHGDGRGTIVGDTMHYCVSDDGIGYVKLTDTGAIDLYTSWNGQPFPVGQATRAPPSEGTNCTDFSGTWDMWDCDEYGGKGEQISVTQSQCNVNLFGLQGLSSGKMAYLRPEDPSRGDFLLYAYDDNVLLTGWGHCTLRRA